MSGKIKVILLDNVRWQWNKWEVIEVSAPYAKNVLIAKWQAKIADAQTLNKVKQHEEKKVKDHSKKLQEMESLLNDLKQNPIVMKKQATAMNHLYDTIDFKEISWEILVKYKIKLEKNNLKITEKIQNTGEYEIWFEYESIKGKFKLIVEKK